jgi:hypothetical protein
VTVESDLVRYVVWRTSDYDGSPVVTRIVKLVYLVDLTYSRERRRHELGFSWRYYHYGPFAVEVQDALDVLQSKGRVRVWMPTRSRDTPRMYRPVGGRPTVELPNRLFGLTDELCSRWGNEELNKMLDFVYFETPPMRHAVRGADLDMLADLDERWPPFYRPLPPPDVSEALRSRLSEWRRAHSQAMPRLRLEPPPRYDASYVDLMQEHSDNDIVPAPNSRVVMATDFDPDEGR